MDKTDKIINGALTYASLGLGIAGIVGILLGNWGHIITALAGFALYGAFRYEKKEEEK